MGRTGTETLPRMPMAAVVPPAQLHCRHSITEDFT